MRIEPHYIRKVTQADGLALPERTSPVTEVISVETARTMMGLLEAVTRYGTGAAAAQLKHPLGGKTGTTNNYTDAWFMGFSPSVTCGTWIGFDNRRVAGGEGDRGEGGAADVDGLYAGGDCEQAEGGVCVGGGSEEGAGCAGGDGG